MKIKKSKRFIIISGLILSLLISAIFIPSEDIMAAGVAIEISTTRPQPEKGETFTVICRVKSSEVFLDTDFYISYDSKVITFISGGDKVSGGKGLLHVASTGNTVAATKKSFSLQFKAKKTGGAAIGVIDQAKVTDEEGKGMSVSSNQLSVNIVEKGESSTSPEASPSASPEVKISNNTKLKALSCSGLENMQPEFDAKTTEYTAKVDCNTDTLYFSFQTASRKAKAVMSGNEQLQEGNNEAVITVTAESGKKREYHIQIQKETQAQTEQRIQAEKTQADGVAFQVAKQGEQTILKNAYEFYVQDVTDQTMIPAGYVQSEIQIDGIRIPAYTMQNDLDNNYLLLYLKGKEGEANLYQYDREEKTLQRYTGDMIEKVNKSGKQGYVTEPPQETSSNTILYVVIAGCVLIILILLTVLLKYISQRRKYRNAHDDLDY